MRPLIFIHILRHPFHVHIQIFEDARADILLILNDALSAAQFPVATSGEDTEITVPFLFE